MQAAWSPVVIEIRALAQGTQATIGSTATAALVTQRSTMARLRGSGYVHLDAGAALDSITVAIGIIVVKAEAFTVGGVASMPGPLTDIEQAWVWHRLLALGPAVSATDDGGDLSRNIQFEIDSKAQRKVQAGDAIAFVAEGVILAGSPTWDIQAHVREMALLP